jgi:DNA-binding IclR family transcriptional regulator
LSDSHALKTSPRSGKPDRARLKLPRISVVRRLEELIKHGYVERVGNAYRVTDKVNIPELQSKLQRRIDMVTETAKRLAEVGKRAQ